MKKTIFTKLLFATMLGGSLSLTVTNASAQFAFSAGPKVGLASTNFRGTNSANFKSRTSWFYGVFTNFQIGKVLSIQPELLLTERGANVTSNNNSSNISVKYFDIPVLAKIRFPLANEVIFPHVLLGPDFAFRTDLDITGSDTQSGGSVAFNKGNTRKSNIGGLVGAGVDIQTHGNGIFFTIDGRYGWSFQDLNSNDDMITLKHTGWMISAGVGFRIGNASDDAN